MHHESSANTATPVRRFSSHCRLSHFIFFQPRNSQIGCSLSGISQLPDGAHQMAEEKTLDDLFLDTLKDIYYAEKQIVKALPKMAKAATSPDLKAGFEKHLEETEGHIDRLEKVFDILGKPARGKTCDAILGILEEGKSIMEEFKGTDRPRRRPDLRGAGGRALRDRPLRHARDLGRAARPQRRRAPPEADPRRGRGDRQEAEPARDRRGQPQGGVARRCEMRSGAQLRGAFDSDALQPLPGCNCRTCSFAPLLQSSRCGQLPVVRGRSCCVVCVCFS